MSRRLTTIVSTAALAFAVLAPAAQAQPTDLHTFLTFTAPVEIPGRVLPAGRYEFRLADDGDNLDVVQILRGNKVIGTYATVPTVPTDTLRATSEKPYVTFEQPVAYAPPAIRVWFYPGESTGQEFLYPKTRAVALAHAAHRKVKATTDDMTRYMNADQPAAQQQAVAALKKAPIQEVDPAGEAR